MPVAGFAFTKFQSERKAEPTGKMNIHNNVSIGDVDKKDLSFGNAKHQGLRIKIEFAAKYTDEKKVEVGSINILADVFFIEEEKTIKETLEQWKKGKKLDKVLMSQILGTSYNRCNVQALIMSRDIGLPPPFQLPRIQFG